MPYKGKARHNAIKAMKKKDTLAALRVDPHKIMKPMKPKKRKGKSKR